MIITSVRVEMNFIDCANVATHPTLEAAREYVRLLRPMLVSEELIVDTAYENGETGTVTLTVGEFLGGGVRVSSMMQNFDGGIGATA